MVQWLGLGAFTAGAQVQSLIRELRSHKLGSVAKKKKKKEAKDLNRHLSKDDTQMANKHMKKMFNIITTPIRMAILKNRKQVLARIWRNQNPCALPVGM